MENWYTFHLENALTGEIFDLYATTLTEAKNTACKVKGGNAEDWFEIVPLF